MLGDDWKICWEMIKGTIPVDEAFLESIENMYLDTDDVVLHGRALKIVKFLTQRERAAGSGLGV